MTYPASIHEDTKSTRGMRTRAGVACDIASTEFELSALPALRRFPALSSTFPVESIRTYPVTLSLPIYS